MSLSRKFIIAIITTILFITTINIVAFYVFYTTYLKIYLVEKIESRDKVTIEYINDVVKKQTIDDIESIFSEFFQSDQTRDSALGGIGLGLALTKRLVKMHGGKIGVQSEVNVGSKFWFTIPNS